MRNKRRRFLGLHYRLVYGLAVMMVLLCAVITVMGAQKHWRNMEKQYTNLVFSQAKMASEMIDGDRAAEYYRTGTADEYYGKIQSELEEIRRKNGLEYFYVFVPEENGIAYIWDAGRTENGHTFPLLKREEYDEGDKEYLTAVFSGEKEEEIMVTKTSKYGYLASAYVPIRDSEGNNVALVGVDYPMSQVQANIKRFAINTAGLNAILILISSILYSLFIRRTASRPLEILAEATENFVRNTRENASCPVSSLDIHSSDEIGELYQALCKMETDMGEYLKELRDVTAEKQRIGTELDIAAGIQEGMLPNSFPAFPDRKEFDLFASMTPAKEVGGDFYDFFFLDDDHLALVIADVSGKGVPAALFMAIAKTMIRNQASLTRSPAETLASVNRQLCQNNKTGMFVTVWLAVAEISTGHVRAVNAGHEYPAVQRADGRFEMMKDRHGFVLGGLEDCRYKEYEFDLAPGEALFVYTDGVTEATDPDENMFGTDRLLEVLNRDPAASPEETVKRMSGALVDFMDGAEQFDDITMLMLRRSEEEPRG